MYLNSLICLNTVLGINMHDKEKMMSTKNIIKKIYVDILFVYVGRSPEGTLCRKGGCDNQVRLSASAIN